MTGAASPLLAAAVWLAVAIVGAELLWRLWRGLRGASARGWSVGAWHAAAGLGLMLALQASISAGSSWATLGCLAASGLAHTLALWGERSQRR